MSKTLIPTLPEIGREAIIVMCGALLAALVLSRLPALQAFIRKNTATGDCNCSGHQA